MTALRTGWRPVVVLGTALLVSAVALPAAAADPQIAPAAFFRNDDISAARLSPSGRFLALIVASTSGRTVLAVVAVDSDRPPLVVASAPEADIRTFRWVNDERLVYTVVDLQAAGADQSFGPGLFSVKRDGSEARQLIRVRNDGGSTGTSLADRALTPDHRLLFVPRIVGNDVIVGQYRFDNLGKLLSILPKRLDVATGQASPSLLRLPGSAQGWVFDAAGEPRAVETSTDGIYEVLWRDKERDTWKSLLKTPALSAPWEPLAVDGSDRLYVAKLPAESTAVLSRFDFASGAPEAAPFVATPGFDFRGALLFDDEGKRVVGVRVDTDAETTVWFDDERKKLQALADAKFPGRINRIECRRCTQDGAMLVTSYSDSDPGTFIVYRAATSTWTTIGRVRRSIDSRQMATLDLHRIKSRDGLDLPVWVTTPREKAAAPRAAVVLVHGGPWLRGTDWSWNADAQFLASRGYVVIEPEYRGSTGYGLDHFRAGWKGWGTTMQDDVADAVRWAVAKGLVDGKRICIAGGSYGGYATLMGAIRYPDLYRCGVAWVAVTDPRLMFEHSWANDISREAQQYSLPVLIGDPATEQAMLKAATPAERAAEIKVPIFMAFGSDDMRVPIEHGSKMRAAMRAAGNEPEYVIYPGEGHGWLQVENRVDFWQRVEKFLAKNLN
jgi:acetyl esterase/lipase